MKKMGSSQQRLLLVLVAICRLISTVGLPSELLHDQVGVVVVQGNLSADPADVDAASRDFGGLAQTKPLAVLRPASVQDVLTLVRAAYSAASDDDDRAAFTVSARGHGHSIHGQAQTANGVVIEMGGMKKENRPAVVVVGELPPPSPSPSPSQSQSPSSYYADVWGGELWIDVLKSTLQRGLAPKSWTDYLYLTVGGTLSNAGISGQAFNHGPQISNVHQLDVVTGKGELVTCSKDNNPELFHAVLGGLGQFGVITRARIALEPAPQRVRWIRVLYSDFSTFTRDQEYLISLQEEPASKRFDYVEGFVIVEQGLINNWRSSFFSPRNPVKVSSLGATANGGLLYCLEITKNYDDAYSASSLDQEVDALLKKLDFIPSTVFTTDLPYVDFLDRVHSAELKLRAKGLWDVPHPWLNLLVPKSRIADFDAGVFKGILGNNKTSGPILIYPMNKNKWEERSSAVTPEEDIFYLVALLRSALSSGDQTQTLEYLSRQNEEILDFCQKADIRVKQYLPHYTTQPQWEHHFGPKWQTFLNRKMEFDPEGILATGQRIFSSSSLPSSHLITSYLYSSSSPSSSSSSPSLRKPAAAGDQELVRL